MKAAVSVPDTTRKNKITAPLYELRLSAIGTIESHGSLCAGMRPPASGATRPGQHAGDETQRRENPHGGKREAVDLLRVGGGLTARPPEETHAEHLDEAG